MGKDVPDSQVEHCIIDLVHKRGPGKTICPSEVARLLVEDENAWRTLMPRVREVAARLAVEGKIKVTQKGAAVNALEAKGPIRLGLT